MRLCVGTSKGIVILDPARPSVPRMVLADPSPVWCLAQDCRDPNLLYAGSNAIEHGRGALSRSDDGGRSWVEITPPAAREEEVWALAASPTVPGRIFFGTSHARLFRSDDGGRTFHEMAAFLKIPGRERWTFPSSPHIPHVRSIAFDPHAPNTIYMGVEEGGIYRSRDLGESFEALNDGLYEDVHTVAIDRKDPRRLYATTGAGFHLSEDGGQSWRRIKEGLDRTYTVPMVIVEEGGEFVLYTAAAAGPPPSWQVAARGADSALYRSVDGGRSFELLERRFAPERGMPMRFRERPGAPGEFFGVSTTGTVFRYGASGNGYASHPLVEKLPPAYDLTILP